MTALEMFRKWGYTYDNSPSLLTIFRLVDDITWVKQTVNRKLAKGHGFYLQHAKETCLVGMKGMELPNLNKGILRDEMLIERRGQSQKPTEIYEYVEALVPGGMS